MKGHRIEKRLVLRDTQTIQELALTIQESFQYASAESALAEQIVDLANKLEALLEVNSDELR
jgi:hypothetical protein